VIAANLKRGRTMHPLFLADPSIRQLLKLYPRKRLTADAMAFRDRVLELIDEAGSEAELERRAGLPASTLSHYSRAKPSEPTRPYLIAIATAMDVHLDWLCAGRGPKRISPVDQGRQYTGRSTQADSIEARK
jgi:transcriptional regulator with XRE-family HTH domain